MVTKDKDFKRLVRQRMERTGEPYTVARSHFEEPSSSESERFPIGMSRWWRALGGRRLLAGKSAEATISREQLSVRFGDVFRVQIPLSSIRRAKPYAGRVKGWGVHGGEGVWLVNGSGKGVVALQLDPPATAHIKTSYEGTIELTELRLSLEDPDRFLARVQVDGAS